MPDPVTLGLVAAGGGLLSGIGSLFGSDPRRDFQRDFDSSLAAQPTLRDTRAYNPADVSFSRFDGRTVDEAAELLEPQLELALANSRRNLRAANATSGAAVAAGGLSPAAAAALASRNAYNTGHSLATIRAGFAGEAINLGNTLFQGNLAAEELDANLRQRQAEFGVTSDLERARLEFMAEQQRRQMALQEASVLGGHRTGNFGDFLSGVGDQMLGAGLYGYGSLIGSN